MQKSILGLSLRWYELCFVERESLLGTCFHTVMWTCRNAVYINMERGIFISSFLLTHLTMRMSKSWIWLAERNCRRRSWMPSMTRTSSSGHGTHSLSEPVLVITLAGCYLLIPGSITGPKQTTENSHCCFLLRFRKNILNFIFSILIFHLKLRILQVGIFLLTLLLFGGAN